MLLIYLLDKLKTEFNAALAAMLLSRHLRDNCIFFPLDLLSILTNFWQIELVGNLFNSSI